MPHVFTIIFAVILLLGVIVGTLLTKKDRIDALSDLGIITKEFIEVKAGQTFLQNFSSSFISGSLFAHSFFYGVYRDCTAAHVGSCIFKGLGGGLSMGYAYSTLGQNGILAALVFLLPNALFIAFSILWAAKESLKLSVLFFLSCFQMTNHTALGKHAKKMCVKYVGVTAFLYCRLCFGKRNYQPVWKLFHHSIGNESHTMSCFFSNMGKGRCICSFLSCSLETWV